ncbi:MAG TPA: DUF2721 domain-containing protein [Gemmataceae bacterium]|nr:DUF2721 domain-containing protein [Gemmataceae bacterium]
MGLMFDPGTAGTAGVILGAMITPAVLISASGTLVLSTTNRLSRIVDRVRVLHTQAEALPAAEEADQETAEKRALISDQIIRQAQRINLLQAAATSLYLAISLLVATSLAVGVSASAGGAFAWVPVGLGLCGATALLVGAVLLIREARLAVRSTLAEMEYVKRVVARKTGYLLVPSPPDEPNAAAS